MINGMNFFVLYRNLARFGPVTRQSIYDVKNDNFCGDTAKIGISRAIYLRISWTDLYQLCTFGRHMGGDDYPDIRSPKYVAMATS